MKRIPAFFLSACMIFLLPGCEDPGAAGSHEASGAVDAASGPDSSDKSAAGRSETASGNIAASSAAENHSSSKTQSKVVSTVSSKSSRAGSSAAPVAVVPTKITMADQEITLEKGRTWAIKYTLTPSNASASYITFSSSDTGVVTVSKTGVVTPAATSKGGVAAITAALPNGVKATMKVNIIYHEPADSETLAAALSKKGITIPQFAATGKLGSGWDDEVTCEYAVWAYGSNGAKYSSGASIYMNNASSPLTVTLTVCVKVNKAPAGGADESGENEHDRACTT